MNFPRQRSHIALPSAILAFQLLALLLCQGQVYEKIFSFTEARAVDPANFLNTGAYPRGGMIQASDGNYYGTTSQQNIGHGTIYRMTPEGALITFVEFTGNTGDNLGHNPYGTLIQASDGQIYGMTFAGGTSGAGTIFRVDTTGSLTTLVEFTGTGGSNKGANPYSSLIQGSDGNFYGTTSAGGSNDAGTIFRMTPAGAMTTIVEFTGTGGNGSGPRCALVQATDGNYYGTTRNGGISGSGTVFRTTPTGVLTTLTQFTGAGDNGKFPEAGLVEASDGNFYGTTREGGANDLGTVFRVTKAAVLTTLVEFTGNGTSDKGSYPIARLIQGSDGELYGTSNAGGQFNIGTVFRMTLAGELTTLNEPLSAGGTRPHAELLQGSDGNFLFTTNNGSFLGYGTVIRMTPSGDITNLVQFTDTGVSKIGRTPFGQVIQDTDGMLYGTTLSGGFNDGGTVFKMSPAGVHTTFVDLSDHNGNNLYAGLLKASNGDFYGTTRFGGTTQDGTVFRISPTGDYTLVVEFTGNGATDKGRWPNGLIEGSDGNIYGTTSEGGATNDGTVFRMTPEGVVTTLAEFSNNGASNKGRAPRKGLVQGADGSFYGTTSAGGVSNLGTVFKITSGGQLTTLTEFTGNGPSSTPQTFGNSAAITINDSSIASPYPSNITVPEGIDKIANVRVILRELTHSYPSDTRFLLKSPNGTTCLLAAQAGGGIGISNITLTLDDDAPIGIPVPIVVGTYRPTPNNLEAVTLTAPAPAGPYGTQLSVFDGEEGSGEWSLFITDALGGDLGSLAGGWSLELTPSDTRGSEPDGVLVSDGNGDFFGTTIGGGTQGRGTVFQIKPNGVMTTLVDFTGNGATNKGFGPRAGLVEGPDGLFYGTTSGGGVNFPGTVFQFESDGTVAGTNLTSLVEFASDPPDSTPYAPLSLGIDGNLYGTTAGALGGDGSVYSIVFPGAPAIALLPPKPPGTTTEILEAKVNPRGSSTSVTLEFWTGGIEPPDPLPTPVPIAIGLTGFQSKLVGTTLTGLQPGTVYYYRFRAESSAGTTQGPVATFSPVESVATLAPPVVVGLPATSISPTSAILNGTVNARNYESAVFIEWGTDGNNFPNKVIATPDTVTGDTPVPVSFPLGNQQPGQTYFYRVVATNEGGISTSGTQTYRTLIPASATVTDATALSTTRAQVTGFVDPKGSSADISFEYGTDGINFPNSFSASPASASGNSATEVTATLTGLTQGTTYHFRIRATGPGGTGLSETSTLSLSILSGLQQVFPDPPPAADGTVTVNFTPTSVGAWRFTGDTEWKNSGVAAGNLATGQRTIEFIPIPGFIRPPSETVDVTSSGNISLDRIYFETATSGNGALTVQLKPDALAGQGVAEANRIQWRIVGETDWRNSGTQLGSLAVGSYLVECKQVTGRETPPITSVAIGDGASPELTLTYFIANTSGGLPPVAQTFSDVSTDEDLPFAYVGQIKSEVGSSTGFVVKRRVVATAGHVVFDDGTLSAVTDLQWFFQRHSDVHEPKPQIPRGYYLAAGYAQQRDDDQKIFGISPGEGSAESQKLDYAALYFTEEAGRGGYGGYLASDSGNDNEFLEDSTAEKLLAGYPVDGIPTADKGKLHATAAFTSALSPAATLGETWTTTAVQGLGGISGGPLFVRFENGNYLPAAIYLGGAGQTVVRAIDSDVVELFLRAEVSGNGGDNNTGGGVTHSSVVGNLNVAVAGSLRVIIEPASANSTGAAWQLNPETTLRQSGSQKSGLSEGTYNVTFTTVAGFTPPSLQQVAVTGGQLTTVTFTYEAEVTATALETWRQDNFQTTENTGDAADSEDPDKDGVKNIDEFTAGTDPNSAADVFKLESPTKSGSTFTAGCAGKAGRIYTLQRNTGLDGVWTPLTSQGPLTSDEPVSLTDPAAPAGTSFYRIEVSIP